MSDPKFVHDDVVKLVHGGETGTVKAVRRTDTGCLYTVELRTQVGHSIEVPEADLELLQMANADETGLHIRYIS